MKTICPTLLRSAAVRPAFIYLTKIRGLITVGPDDAIGAVGLAPAPLHTWAYSLRPWTQGS
jgi:hypothetical protein